MVKFHHPLGSLDAYTGVDKESRQYLTLLDQDSVPNFAQLKSVRFTCNIIRYNLLIYFKMLMSKLRNTIPAVGVGQ